MIKRWPSHVQLHRQITIYGWGIRPLVGTHQHLLGGYEARSLLIADSERMACCGPSSSMNG